MTTHDERSTHPTAAMRTLDTLVQCDRLRDQGFISILATMCVGWDGHVAAGFKRWKHHSGRSLPGWLKLWQDLDIAGSLQILAHLTPTVEATQLPSDGPMIVATDLRHPLIPDTQSIGNTLRAEAGTLIITGSNMSGKSTFLRTLGLNSLLARAGCPIPATSFACRPFAIYTSIRTEDRLSEGVSQFYAEILRIQSMRLALDRRIPTLFLIDEIFHGTNAADRLFGAEHALRILRGRDILTVVTTHDDALCALRTDPDVRARNMHFTDSEREGRLYFDYTLKEGRATRTNARTLLRLAGLWTDSD